VPTTSLRCRRLGHRHRCIFCIYANLFIFFKYLNLFIYILVLNIYTNCRNSYSSKKLRKIACVCTLSRRVGLPHNVFVSTCCVQKVLLDRNLKPRVCPLHVCTCADRVYSETLAYCTRVVYPPRFLQTAPSWGARVFHRLWLDICSWKAKVCPCIAPEARSTAKS
jgi:hypothetical protein